MKLKYITPDGNIETKEVIGWWSVDTKEWTIKDRDMAVKLGLEDLYDDLMSDIDQE